jgi:hypothetical protein
MQSYIEQWIEQWIARSRRGWEVMRKTEWGEMEERTKKLEGEQIQTGQQEQAYEEREEQWEQNEAERTKKLGEEQIQTGQQEQAYEEREEQWEQNEAERTKKLEEEQIQTGQQEQAYLDGIEGTTYQTFLSKFPTIKQTFFSQLWKTKQTFLSQLSIENETWQDLKGLHVSDVAVSFDWYKNINEAGVGELCNIVVHSTGEFDIPVDYLPLETAPTPTTDPFDPFEDIEDLRRDQDSVLIQNGDESLECFLVRAMLTKCLTILSPVSCFQEADRFVITDDPINALRHRQLERTGGEQWRVVVGAKQESVSYDPQSTVYLSTHGNIKNQNQIRKDLETVFKLAYEQGKTVVLAMDKNQTGGSMSKSLVYMLKDAGTNYHIEEPALGLNWEDTLSLKPNLFQNQNIKDKFMRERQAELTKACELLERETYWKKGTYKDSVLPQLGIEQETLEYFKDQVKAIERSVVMTLHPIGVAPEIQPTQAAVINKQEVGVEKPAQTVVGRWSLSVNQQGSIQLPVSEGLPPVSILIGDPKQASKVVLVGSPLDALLHYQAQHQLYREGENVYVGGHRIPYRELLDSICYVYVGQKGYEVATEMFKNMRPVRVEPVLAIRGDQDNRFDSLEESLRQQRFYCHKEPIDTNAQVYKKLNLLAGLLQGVAGVRGVGEEGGEEGEEEQQREKISKKQGYRPSL